MTLRDFIEPGRATGRIVTPNGEWPLEALPVPEGIQDQKGTRQVALHAMEIPFLMGILQELDGWAEDVLLIPGDWTPEAASATAQRVGIHRCISGLGAEPGATTATIPATPSPRQPSIPPQTTSWILTTSGTTGEPKLVRHTLRSLTRTLQGRPLDPDACWGLLYDPARFAGLQVVLHAVHTGATLACPDPHMPLPEQMAFLRCRGCDSISATPTQWRKILMAGGGDALSLTRVTLGGEIADAAILRALARAFPRARITHIYASTETGVGFSVRDGLPGFPEAYLEHPPQGLQLRIHEGRLFVAEYPPGASPGEFIDTGDRVECRDGRIYFLGRAGGLINVGGHKVYPEEIEQFLLRHPRVAFARVSGRKSPITGSILTAAVVPVDSTAETADSLRSKLAAYCREHLPEWKRPAIINLVDALETYPGGKLERKGSA